VVVERAAEVELVAELVVELREQRVDHGEADPVDRPPSAGVGLKTRHGPDADLGRAVSAARKRLVGNLDDDRVHAVAGEGVDR
jgi:hypothetical protein